jgi:hypothetical protein
MTIGNNTLTVNTTPALTQQQQDEDHRYNTFKQCCDSHLPRLVSKEMFNYNQFVDPTLTEGIGSPWQKLLCQLLPGGNQAMKERYWKHAGCKLVKKTINRRRNSATTAMKNKFIRKIFEDVQIGIDLQP